MTDTLQEDSSDINFGTFLVTLGQEKAIFIGTILLGVIISIALILLLPRYYTASTLLLPPQQQSSNISGALAQLGSLGGIASLASGIKTPEELYVALLKSRSVQDHLISKFNLKQRYDTDLLEKARKKLNKNVSIRSDKKTGLITVDFDDRDPDFAAQLANAHVDALRTVLSRLAVTESQQKRQFFQEQVSKTQNALNAAELRFRQTQAATGLVVTQALAESGVRESAQLRGQIAAREVQMQTLARFATPNHPDVQRVSAELAALRSQLTNIERGSGNASKLNADGMEAVQAYREMQAQETMLKALITQFELARADEAKEGPLLQQVDVATTPEKAQKPQRALVIILGTLAGLLLGVVLALLKHSLKENDQSWQRISAAWKFGNRER